MPTTAGKSNPNKYLIETNPALTDLHQFLNSDCLLAKLGYDPDDSAKRLGNDVSLIAGKDLTNVGTPQGQQQPECHVAWACHRQLHLRWCSCGECRDRG
ncbi:hypothetical protein LN139_20890 [Pseudomonas sp. KNUC1026]|nr:hypothetical protein [Pseudomonas sp. KNUC1026]UFH49294.1 hypothetical protein LN139_20890 [Pseudomonas sp. KNUC1026]